MAFGDQLNIVQGNNLSTSLTVTYSGGTLPSADDLNVAYAFTGATTISSMTAGFSEDAELLNTSNNDEGGLWSQVAADSGDDTITMTPSGDDENALILVLVEGAFDASPADLTSGWNAGPSSADPIETGASVSSTAVADELMCGITCSRDVADESVDDWNRQGTATPTSAMTKAATEPLNAKRLYAASQVLTATGTVGISRENNAQLNNMVGYATYKRKDSAPTGPITGSEPEGCPVHYKRIIDFSDGGEARFFEEPENGKDYVAVRAASDLPATAALVLRLAPTTVLATPYAVAEGDRILLVDDDAVGGAVTVDLPPAVDNKWRELEVKKIGSTANVTVDGYQSETIDEETTKIIVFQYDAMQLFCDGVGWWII